MDIRRIVARNHALAIVLLALILTPASAMAGQHKQFRKRGPTQLPFRLSHGVLIQIPGRMGRLNSLRFALDTGTTETGAWLTNYTCRASRGIL